METIKLAMEITGADLQRQGFKRDSGRGVPPEGWYVKGEIRVVQDCEDGLRVYAFCEPERLNLEWQATFTGETPADVVMSMILKTVGG